MQNWILYTIINAIFTGFFECSKKKASEKNSIYEVLAIFSTIAFLIIAFTNRSNLIIEFNTLYIILLKSLAVAFSWLLGIYAISKMPISLYSVINLSKIIFSVILSILFLGEKITSKIILGIIIIIIGLIFVNKPEDKENKKETTIKVILILLLSCLLNSISSIMDKEILKYITPNQLQFWFLFFVTICYWCILLFKRQKINIKNIKSNYWILLIAIFLIIGDRFLFKAKAICESKVTIITLLRQLSVIEGIILGKVFFKEKNIIKKLLCSLIVILGIVITLV